VIEVAHSIEAVVTMQTGKAKLVGMFLHESWMIAVRVACDAGLQVETLEAAHMARDTFDCFPGEVHSMAFQAEPAEVDGVLEDKSLPACRIPGFRGVAVGAIHTEQSLVGLWLGVTFMTLEGRRVERPGKRCSSG